MNKNTILTTLVAIAGLSAPTLADEHKAEQSTEVPTNPFSEISGALNVGYGTKQLGNYGFTLVDAPYHYANIFAQSGPFSLFSNWKMSEGEFKGSFSEVNFAQPINDDMKLTYTLQLYDSVGYDTWFEAGASITKPVGPLTAKVGAMANLNGSNSGVLLGELAYSRPITEKLRMSLSNTTTFMIGDYHGVSDFGANSTTLRLTYDVNKSTSVFGMGRFNKALDAKLETDVAFEFGITKKF